MRSLCTLLAISCAVQVLAAQQPGVLDRHLAAAQDAQAHTDCHTASHEYEAAVRLMPASGELRTNLGIALYCDGQFQPAERALRMALRLAPTLAAPHLFLGLASYHLADFPAAHRELTVFLKHSPDDATANLWLGYTLVAQGSFDIAEKQFEHTRQLQPANLDALYAVGETALELGRRRARALEELAPRGPSILKLAAQQYRLQGDSARSEAALAEAQKRTANADEVPATVQKEETLYSEATAWETKAQDAFQTIVHLAPESYRAHQIMADSLVAMQQQERAIPEYESVIEANPTLPGVHESLSRCLMTAGRFKDALAALRAEQALSPAASAQLLTQIGQVQVSLGDDLGAATTLQAALKDPDVPAEAFLLLAKIMLQQGHATESIPLFQRYLATDPGSPTAYYQLARAYRKTGNQIAEAQAIANFKRTSEDVKARALVTPILHPANAPTLPEDSPGTQAFSDPGHALQP